MHKIFFILALSFSCTCTAFCDYQADLLTQAKTLQLSSNPQWLALIHYPQLKVDPESELEKTIRDFFITSPLDDTHPQCRNPARYMWIDSMLHFDKPQIPSPNCKDFKEWFSLIEPYGTTLIFPSSFLNNPASAFGHTFLRIDRPPSEPTGPLLTYAANYSAATHGEPGPVYAFKGLFGGYDGFFSVLPFYLQVTKYSDMESRDIWEYKLSFTPEETRLLTAHLWELRASPFPYYYLDDNCSSQLLSLLDVARPSLKLHESFSLWVIPVDTVKEILTRKDLVTDIQFRPSASSILKTREEDTDKKLRFLAKQIVDDNKALQDPEIADLSQEEKAKTLDLAYDYLNFRSLRKKEIDPADAKNALQLLKARSANPTTSDPVIVPTPPIRPDEGHKTKKVSYGVGMERNKLFQNFHFRTAYHSLIDPPDGYLPGSQIEFLDTEIRQSEGERVSLHDLTVLNIFSLSPRDDLIKPLSWHLNTEFYRERMKDDSEGEFFTFEGGGGRSWDPASNILLYALLDVSSKFSNDIEQGYAVGSGPRIGALIHWNEFLNTQLDGAYYYYGFGDIGSEPQATAKQRFVVSKNQEIGLDVKYKQGSEASSMTVLGQYELFF